MSVSDKWFRDPGRGSELAAGAVCAVFGAALAALFGFLSWHVLGGAPVTGRIALLLCFIGASAALLLLFASRLLVKKAPDRGTLPPFILRLGGVVLWLSVGREAAEACFELARRRESPPQPPSH